MEVNLTQDLILENDRVMLRPLVADDFKDLLPYALYEPDLWKYSLLPADGAVNLQTYIQYALQERQANRSLAFVVIDKKDGSIAGSTRFYDYQARHNTIQLGFTWYGKKYWSSGLNKNCKYLLLKEAFEVWNLDRVEFRADKLNQRSIYAMKSIGCVEEGVLRSNCASPNGRRDSIVFSILREEWWSVVKPMLIIATT